jgi:hypothetical protein
MTQACQYLHSCTSKASKLKLKYEYADIVCHRAGAARQYLHFCTSKASKLKLKYEYADRFFFNLHFCTSKASKLKLKYEYAVRRLGVSVFVLFVLVKIVKLVN